VRQSTQRSGAETLGIGLPGFRKLKDFLGNKFCHAIARILEPGRFARHPVSCAHRVYDLKRKAIDRQTLLAGHGTLNYRGFRIAEIVRVGEASKARSKSIASPSMASECQQAETDRIISR
jgi:hypothetical protein